MAGTGEKTVSRRGFVAGTAVSAGLTAFSVGAASICEGWSGTLDQYTGSTSSVVETSDKTLEGTYSYTSDYSTTDELVQAHKDFNEQAAEEGSVLLKNDGTLPLKAGAAVTLLSLHSHYPFYGERMGGTVEPTQCVSLEAALADRGFSVNQTMVDLYEAMGNIVTGTELSTGMFGGDAEETDVYGYQPSELSINLFGPSTGVYRVGEPPLSVYEETNPDYAASFSEYGDAAIVVIGRPSSEGGDYGVGTAGLEEGESGTDPLALNEEEKAVIELACSNFEHVAVLLNTVSQIQIDELKHNDKIGAIMWVGLPGCYGFNGVADLLAGNANPSGHMTDTYAASTTSTPAIANFGTINFTNSEVNMGTSYIVEAEGIYTGYKYYETRYADAVMGQGNADSSTGSSTGGSWNYADEVSYGFGFGLSYTTFEQTLDSVEMNDADHTATVKVTVTNTGEVAGKGVAQVYASTPYTDYDRENLVEKAAIQLVDYAKTDSLEPGESQTLTLEFDMKYFASFDYQGEKTFIMDAGDYYLAIGNGAHDALNNVLAAQGYTTADGMDAEGDASLTYTWNLAALDAKTYATAPTGARVESHLENMDLNYWLPGTVTYLSRQDWEGTWPQTYEGISLTDDMVTELSCDWYEIQTDEDTSSIFPEKDNGANFMAMKGVPFDDPSWDDLMDQMSLEEAVYGIRVGGSQPKHYDSVNQIVDALESDSPTGINTCTLGTRSTDADSPIYIPASDANYNYMLNDYVCEAVVASAFDKDLALAQGTLFGEDTLWAVTTIFFAPGMNLHRVAYCGRNGEYYSEDPMVTNYCASNVIAGSRTKGAIMTPKHLAFNDQESGRTGLAVLMTEQKAREAELRSFEGIVDAGCQGIMTSLNRVGLTTASAHVGLMQDIVRGEWGYTGFLMTDICFSMYTDYMNVKECAIGGTTLMGISSDSEVGDGGNWEYFTADGVRGDATLCQAIRDDTKYLLVAIANSNAMNGKNETSKTVSQMTWWRGAYGAAIGVTGLATLACAALYARSLKKEGVEA